jgi:alkanesulfonate monooxygenase SsuD/methylene tetrahydromethanopterin reductase-like flavin-dependent oxidoreductase (luciferase family)
MLAAHFGLALSFAQFINPVGGAEAIRSYKERFRPSESLSAPKASVGIFAFCSDDPQKVKEVQAVMDYRLLSFEKGRYDEIPSYAVASAYQYTSAEWQRVLFNRQRMAVGSPDYIRLRFEAIAEEFDVDEIVISTFTEHFEDRLRSYELMASVAGLVSRKRVPEAARNSL